MIVVQKGFALLFFFAMAVFVLQLVRNQKNVVPLVNSFWSGIGTGLSYEVAAGGGTQPVMKR